MTKTIVTGVDHSPTAASAARQAAELASSLGAELRVVSAYGRYEVEKFTSGDEEFFHTTEKEAHSVAEEVVADLRSALPQLEVIAEPAEGKPAQALVRVTERTGADLIVVGNRRVQGIARVLGSIAFDVAAHAPCDVYIVHTHRRPGAGAS